MIDYNCFIGGWPFHKVRLKSFEDLKKLHLKNGIDEGYVSITDSIFFNDPYESEKELAKQIKGSNYHHVMTVNPLLPGCFSDIERAVSEFNIAAVRILPGFHNYKLDCDEVRTLCRLLYDYKLPLYLTLRMEDERLTYMFHTDIVPINEVKKFLNLNNKMPIFLCNVRLSEIKELRDEIFENENLRFDSSGLKDFLFPLELLSELNIRDKLVFGSLAPIFCLKSTLLIINS